MRRSDREITDFQELITVMRGCDVCRLALHDDCIERHGRLADAAFRLPLLLRCRRRRHRQHQSPKRHAISQPTGVIAHSPNPVLAEDFRSEVI